MGTARIAPTIPLKSRPSLASSARLSYALGEERELPSALTHTNKRGVPVGSILLSTVIGLLAFGPFKSWAALVNVITAATAIMYAFAPISLAALHKVDRERPRAYRVPIPAILLPAAFCSANLIIYWGGFDTTWKLGCAICFGLALFVVGALRTKTAALSTLRNSFWIAPWLAGQVLIGYLGRYGNGASNTLPNWIDIVVVVGFALAIFHYAVRSSLSAGAAAAAIARDTQQLESAVRT